MKLKRIGILYYCWLKLVKVRLSGLKLIKVGKSKFTNKKNMVKVIVEIVLQVKVIMNVKLRPNHDGICKRFTKGTNDFFWVCFWSHRGGNRCSKSIPKYQ